MYDFVVIGAGVVGGLVARKLSSREGSVCIVEKASDVAMGASKANSAIVHAGFDAHEGSLKAELNVKGSEMMEKIAKELGVPYIRNGALVVGFNEEDLETIENLKKRGIVNGVKGLEVLKGDEIRAKEKNIGDTVKYALYAPTSAIVCPYDLTIAAVGNAMDNGADLELDFEVCKIEKTAKGYTVTAKSGKKVEAKAVINCAGVNSDEVAKMADANSDISVHARRGEYMIFDRECGGLVNCTIFRTPSKMGKGILVTPTVDGNLLIGPTAEDIDDKDNKETTPEGLAKVLGQAKENVNGIMPGKVITSFCGLRSVGNTGDFIINIKDGFVNAAGIESPGLSSSPAIAEYIADMLDGAGLLPKEKKNFNPCRKPFHFFKDMSADEKNELIKKEPAYGKIVCRCETITEGEILNAMRSNPKATTVDAVKRRTRAGMGRCQGGFCMSVVTDLLARELGVSYEKITKDGEGSYINIGRTKGDK